MLSTILLIKVRLGARTAPPADAKCPPAAQGHAPLAKQHCVKVYKLIEIILLDLPYEVC